MDENQWLASRFEEQRTYLRAVACRMLGSLAEADDTVQDAWLRLSGSSAGEVENLRGWLTAVVTRLCLNVLRPVSRGPRSPSRAAWQHGAQRPAVHRVTGCRRRSASCRPAPSADRRGSRDGRQPAWKACQRDGLHRRQRENRGDRRDLRPRTCPDDRRGGP